MNYKVHHPLAVAEFIVIPRNELDRVMVEDNANPRIQSGRMSVTVKVIGDYFILSVAWDEIETWGFFLMAASLLF